MATGRLTPLPRCRRTGRPSFSTAASPMPRARSRWLASAGTNLHDLTDNSQFRSEHPNWSPNGRKIVFETDPPGGSPNLATINPDGSGFTQLTFSGQLAASLQPGYSLDGTKIIFARFRSTGGTDLFTMNRAGAPSAKSPRPLAVSSIRNGQPPPDTPCSTRLRGIYRGARRERRAAELG